MEFYNNGKLKSTFTNMFNSNLSYDTFILHSVTDKLWVDRFSSRLLKHGYTICQDFSYEKEDTLLSICESGVFIFSDSLASEKRNFSCFHPYLRSKIIDKKTVGNLLNSNRILCVKISLCIIPEEFRYQKVLIWNGNGESQKFWQEVFQFMKASKRRQSIRNALFCKESSSYNEDDGIIDEPLLNSLPEVDAHFSSQNRGEDENKKYDYEMYTSVYPHLLSSSFTAEDEDLTREDLNDLTLKVENVNAILALPPKSESDLQNKKQKSSFSSQHEQCKVLDALQEKYDCIKQKLEQCNDKNKSKRYRRMLDYYHKNIIDAVNGCKNSDINVDSPDGNVCCCCDTLFHSDYALKMHFSFCVTSHWIELLKR